MSILSSPAWVRLLCPHPTLVALNRQDLKRDGGQITPHGSRRSAAVQVANFGRPDGVLAGRQSPRQSDFPSAAHRQAPRFEGHQFAQARSLGKMSTERLFIGARSGGRTMSKPKLE